MKRLPCSSVFVKLLTIFGTAFAIIVIGALFVHFISSAVPNIDVSLVNVEYYADGLMAEIGSPPSPERAAGIGEKTGLDIAIIGPGIEWSNNEELLAKAREIEISGDFARLRFRELGDWIIQKDRGEYRFFFSEFHSDYHQSVLIWILMTGIVTAALGVSYFMVRGLLSPIREMDAVAQKFGGGDWSRRVAVNGDDELARLGKTMNTMADRLEAYIESMRGSIAGISHEFRSPLTRMKLAIEFIEDEKIRSSLSEEIGALDRITEELLEEKRLSARGGEILLLEESTLGEWIEEVCAPYRNLDVPFGSSVSGASAKIRIDRGRMDIAVRNLIENALKHAPGSPISVSAAASGEAVTVEVSDQGNGLPPELVERVGEPFLLVEPSRTGSRGNGGFGLGLSLVRAIAEAHEGTFSVENRRPRGFAARISIPRGKP